MFLPVLLDSVAIPVLIVPVEIVLVGLLESVPVLVSPVAAVGPPGFVLIVEPAPLVELVLLPVAAALLAVVLVEQSTMAVVEVASLW